MTNIIDLHAKLEELEAAALAKIAEFEEARDSVSTDSPQVPELERALMERELSVIIISLKSLSAGLDSAVAATTRLHALADLYGSARS